MRFSLIIIASLAVTLFQSEPRFIASLTSAGTISGSVNGPDGAPFMGAFVIAENSQNKMSVSVLSDKQGHYHFADLPAATYALRIRPLATIASRARACS